MTRELITKIKREYETTDSQVEELRKELAALGVPMRLLDQKEPISKGKDL